MPEVGPAAAPVPPPVRSPSAGAAGNASVTLAFAVAVVLGGFNSIAIHASNQELPPFWGGAVRFGLAALLLAGYALLRRAPWPGGRALVGALAYGLLGFGATFALIYWGMVEVAPGLAQVLMATMPLFTILLAVAQRQEAFSWRRAAGATVAVAGIAVVFREQLGLSASPWRLAAIVAAAACFAQGAVVAKRFPRSDPVTVNAVAMGAGAVLLLAASRAAAELHVIPQRPETMAWIASLVVLGTVAVFSLYLFVLRSWPASATAYQFLLLPVVTVVASAAMGIERLTATFLLGGALVLAGVYVGVFLRAPAGKAAPHPAPAAPAPPPGTDGLPSTAPKPR